MSNWLDKSKRINYYSRVFDSYSHGRIYVMYEKAIDFWGSPYNKYRLKEVGRVIQGYLLLEEESKKLEYHPIFDIGFCRGSHHDERYYYTGHSDKFFEKWFSKHMEARDNIALEKRKNLLKNLKLKAPCFLILDNGEEKYESQLHIDSDLNFTWKYGTLRNELPFIQDYRMIRYKLKSFDTHEEIIRYTVLTKDEVTSYELDNLMLL